MREISNSLRQRLGAIPEPQEHPDSDVLTAYSEQLLPAAERREVVLHLAQCSNCREVVSLSLPQASPGQEAMPAAFRRSRLWIPAFRWGAALAVLAVAATLIVEKPWKQGAVTQAPPDPASSAARDTQRVPPATTASTPAATVASATPSSPELRADAGAGLRRAVIPEPRIQQSRSASLPQSSGTTGFLQNGVAISRLETVAPASVPMAAAPAQPLLAESSSGSAYKYAERDYVNTNVLKNEGTFTSNGLAAADANLPQAPAARNTAGLESNGVAKSFPPISSDVGSRAFAVNVVPPNTAATPASGTPDVTTLKTSRGGFKIASRVRDEVSDVVHGIQKAGALGGPPSGLAEFSAAKKPNFTDNKEKAQSAPLFHWRINGDGILMKSTDYTGWHEAYPQSSDLQFKVLVTRGDHVWAGGNNATLIHSWNGGVQWETLKVPDSGDITSITIDDGWQVRTSNGQTFVSQDKGKTWVPLQAEPK